MTQAYNKLNDLLKELFQFDREDLDFGIYRILNHKREEAVRFLDKDLLPQVQQAFSEYRATSPKNARGWRKSSAKPPPSTPTPSRTKSSGS